MTENRKLFLKKAGMNLLSVLSLVLFLLLWIWFSTSFNSFMPTPLQVVERFERTLTEPVAKMPMWGHTLMSLRRVGLGLLFATLIGIPFGTFIGWNSTFRALFQPLFEMIRPIPPLAWVPLITVWFGIGETPKVILVFIGTFTPIVVNTYSGVRLLAAEMISANSGLGMLVTRGSDSGDLPLTILSMIIIGIVGALMSAVFTVIERKLSPWRIDIN